MSTRTRLTTFVIALIAIAALPVTLLGRPLPTDPRIATGKLSNGVTWVYRQHDNPPGKMALMIHVDTGSLNEKDSQRGLAHFIEHMAFNGSENFPPGALIPYFESIGMEFGGDLNAFTSFDQTAYMLFTPNTDAEQISKALMVLSDYAFRMSLIDEELDKERGVILEESRTGKSAFQRIRDKLYPELYEGSRIAKRLVIGDEEVIANAPRSEFADYYRAWYRPENITLLMVGDAPRDAFAPLIEKWFGQYKPDTPARKQHGPEFTMFTKQRGLVVTDPEMAFCRIQMMNIRPGRPPIVTTEQGRTELVEYLGSWVVDRRYEELVNKGEASFRRAGVGVTSFFNDALLISGSASGEPQDWAKMLEQIVMEVNRAREFGFTEREYKLAKKEIIADFELAVKQEPTQSARRFIRRMVRTVNNKEPIMSAQQDLDVLEELLPTIALGEVNQTFKEHFTPGTFAYIVTMVEKEGVAVPTRDEVVAAARAAWARKVEPIKEEEAPTELLTSLPTPGKIVEKTVDEDLGITSAWLENGVRVHHRFIDYKKNSVWVSIALAGGQIEENASNAGITEVAALAVEEAATNRLTSTNIRDIMTGKNIKVSAGGQGDSLTVTVAGAPEDLEVGLQLAYALLTDGKIEEAAFKNWKLRTLQLIDMFDKMPRFKAYEAMEDLLSGGDPRRTRMTREKVEAQSVAAAQAWFTRLRKEAPIEVAVVGDIQREKAMPLIERYLGSLPKRDRSAKHLDKLRRVARPTGPLTRHVKVETMTPQATTFAGFMGCEGRNTFDRRAMQLASNTLSSRVIKRIREDLSLVYSIRASHNPSWIYEDAGRFMAGAPCDPAKAEKVADEIHKMFKAFADEGPTEEELANAKKQIAENLDTGMREPTYWWRILRHHDLHGRDLAQQKIEKAAFERYTGEQVKTVFRKYYTPIRQFSVIALPTKAEKPEEEKAPAGTAPSGR